jgi:hypothetical protein
LSYDRFFLKALQISQTSGTRRTSELKKERKTQTTCVGVEQQQEKTIMKDTGAGEGE